MWPWAREAELVLCQGDHSSGKPGKDRNSKVVRESQGKSGKMQKVTEKLGELKSVASES